MKAHIYISQERQERMAKVYQRMVKEGKAIPKESWDKNIARIMDELLDVYEERTPTN